MLYINRNTSYLTDDCGKVISNWNPELDYGNEYANIYFRIEAGYVWGKGIEEEKDRKFNAEIKSLMEPLGWEWDKTKNRHTDGDYENWGCGYISRGKEILYIHPMDISGEILKNSVKEIVNVLEKGVTFKCYKVDIYKDVYDISAEQYDDYLNSKSSEIKQELFEHSKTKRTYKFHYVDNVARNVAQQFMLKRVNIDRNVGGVCDEQTYKFVNNTIDEMIKDGYLKSFEDERGKFVRSINKTEQKEAKLQLAFD